MIYESWGFVRYAGGMLDDVILRNLGGGISRLTTEALPLHSLIIKELSHPSCARRHGQVLAC